MNETTSYNPFKEYMSFGKQLKIVDVIEQFKKMQNQTLTGKFYISDYDLIFETKRQK